MPLEEVDGLREGEHCRVTSEDDRDGSDDDKKRLEVVGDLGRRRRTREDR